MQSEARFIKESIQSAIRHLLKNDLFLLVNNVDEWAITHKFAIYLEPYFSDWHVDVEYNRDKDEIKRDNGKDVRPDIIVHIRGTDNNILVIEIKKSNNLHSINADKERLCRFTSQRGKYKYLFGSLVIFYVAEDCRKQPVVEFFQKGKHLD
jgi:hypothetical protein